MQTGWIMKRTSRKIACLSENWIFNKDPTTVDFKWIIIKEQSFKQERTAFWAFKNFVLFHFIIRCLIDRESHGKYFLPLTRCLKRIINPDLELNGMPNSECPELFLFPLRSPPIRFQGSHRPEKNVLTLKGSLHSTRSGLWVLFRPVRVKETGKTFREVCSSHENLFHDGERKSLGL